MDLGIICAIDAERDELLKVIENEVTEKIYDLEFHKGTIKGKSVVLCRCGVGKVAAGRTTQVMIDKYDVERIVNYGSAGSLSDDLELADIVIAESCVQADADCSAFGTEKGKFQDYDDVFITLDTSLTEICKQIAEEMVGSENRVVVGTVATQDKFMSDKFEKKEVGANFSALCCEMEGAAVAITALKCNIPCAIVRGISDKRNDNSPVETYEEYKKIASKRCVEFIEKLATKI